MGGLQAVCVITNTQFLFDSWTFLKLELFLKSKGGGLGPFIATTPRDLFIQTFTNIGFRC